MNGLMCFVFNCLSLDAILDVAIAANESCIIPKTEKETIMSIHQNKESGVPAAGRMVLRNLRL